MQLVEGKMERKARVAPSMSSLLYVITGCGMGYMAALQHPKALGDIVEASIGAVFVDSGCDLDATYPVRRLGGVPVTCCRSAGMSNSAMAGAIQFVCIAAFLSVECTDGCLKQCFLHFGPP